MRLLLCRLGLRYVVLVLRVSEFFLRWEQRARYPEECGSTDWNDLRRRVMELRKRQAEVTELLARIGT